MKVSQALSELAHRLACQRQGHPLRVAVDGVDCAGKTTLADALGHTFDGRGRQVLRVSIDGFHNPREVRRRRGDLSPEGYFFDSFDLGAVVRLVLEPLGPGGSLRYRRRSFDFRTDGPEDSHWEHASQDAILLFDGVFLLRPDLFRYWDFTIFVHADFDTTLARALKRDVSLFGSDEVVNQRYQERYIPGQQLYLESCQPHACADVVVDNRDWNNPSLTFRDS